MTFFSSKKKKKTFLTLWLIFRIEQELHMGLYLSCLIRVYLDTAYLSKTENLLLKTQ